jgi:hypothetical protein
MIERETVRRGERVSFYFDPICPWTWITSRWLVDVADQRGMQIDWRSLSLVVLNAGAEAIDQPQSGAGMISTGSLRMIEAMRQNGRDDLIGPFYTALGTRVHVDSEQPSPHLLQEAARDAGVSGYLVAADDRRWDGAVIQSTAEAIHLAGPDTGSPVLRIHGQDRGMHGPIVSPEPRGKEALKLWDVVTAALNIESFYELKHGRTGAPQISREPAVGAAER